MTASVAREPGRFGRVLHHGPGREIAKDMGLALKGPLYVTGGNAIDLNDPVARDAYLLALTQALTIASQTVMRGVSRMLSDPAFRRDSEEDGEVDE